MSFVHKFPAKQFLVGLTAIAVLTLVPRRASAGNEIYACVSGSDHDRDDGRVRIIDASESCKKHEKKIHWNVVGPQGPAGAQGPTGPQGPQGPQGPAGVIRKIIVGGTYADGSVYTGKGFTLTHDPNPAHPGHYTITFPAGTWSAAYPVASFQAFFDPGKVPQITYAAPDGTQWDLEWGSATTFNFTFIGVDAPPGVSRQMVLGGTYANGAVYTGTGFTLTHDPDPAHTGHYTITFPAGTWKAYPVVSLQAFFDPGKVAQITYASSDATHWDIEWGSATTFNFTFIEGAAP
jgi:hypothetical protein